MVFLFINEGVGSGLGRVRQDQHRARIAQSLEEELCSRHKMLLTDQSHVCGLDSGFSLVTMRTEHVLQTSFNIFISKEITAAGISENRRQWIFIVQWIEYFHERQIVICFNPLLIL